MRRTTLKKRSVLLNPPRIDQIKRKKRRALWKKIFLFSFVFAVVIGGLTYLSRIPKFNIQTVEASGNTIVDSSAIQSVAKESMAGHYLGLFPKTNFLLYPKTAVENSLRASFSRLDGVTLTTKGRETLHVAVTEREGKYTWCGISIENTDQKCYFLDKSGYIFDEAPYFSGDIYTKFYGADGVNVDTPIGSQFASSVLFTKLAAFKDSVIAMDLKPRAFGLTGDDVYMYLPKTITSPNGPQVIFKQGADFAKVAEDLQAALVAEPLKSDFKNKYSTLLYIDLRYDNKVYYKFK